VPFSAVYDACVLYPFEIRDLLMVAARTLKQGEYRALRQIDNIKISMLLETVAQSIVPA
jgi:hypothetical protein